VSSGLGTGIGGAIEGLAGLPPNGSDALRRPLHHRLSRPLILGHLLNDIPRPGNGNGWDGKELRRPRRNHLGEFRFKSAEELRRTCKIVFTREQSSDVASAETTRIGDCTRRKFEKTANGP